MASQFLVIVLASFTALGVYLHSRRRRSNLPLPPGPPKLPLVGSYFSLPGTDEYTWEVYQRWAVEHKSNILHIEALGSSVVILNTLESCIEIFERRSSIYSSRPPLPMVNEHMGWSWNFGFMQYGEYWRSHRRLFHASFHENAAKQFQPIQVRAAHILISGLLEEPYDFMKHISHMAVQVLIPISYGIEVQRENDPYGELAELSVLTLQNVLTPGAYLVDTFPVLKYVPNWFPGTSWKREAARASDLTYRLWNWPFETTKHMVEQGSQSQSVVSRGLAKAQELQAESITPFETLVKNIAAVSYVAGADTTTGSLRFFFLAMLVNPDAMRKAQRELDTVLAGQLPTLNDVPALPYITAMTLEVLRWRPVTPLALPHYVEVEDEYKGYRIPAGSVVLGNAWAILNDPEFYPDPHLFHPDRFIKDGAINKAVRDPRCASFGFGRRICPGKHIAFSNIWISIASVLSVFDIEKTKDGKGRVLEPTLDVVPGLTVHPKPFKCKVVPRSQAAINTIRAAAATLV